MSRAALFPALVLSLAALALASLAIGDRAIPVAELLEALSGDRVSSPASAMIFFTAADPRMTCSVLPDTTHSPDARSMDILAPVSCWIRRMVSPPRPMMRPSYPTHGMASSASAFTLAGPPGGGRCESRSPRGGDRRRRRGGDRDQDRDLEYERDRRR